MNIRHQYNSLSPYERCGYERIPAYPAQGEPVSLGFYVEGCGQGPPPALALHWRLDGAVQPTLPLHHCGQGEGNALFFQAELPAQTAFCTVEYWLEDLCGRIGDIYSYQVLQSSYLLEPACITSSRDGVDLWFVSPHATYCWQWKINEQGQLSHALCLTPTSPPAGFREINHRLGDFRLKADRTELHIFEKEQWRCTLPLRMDVRADADGHLWEASFSLRLAGRHVYGTGERYTCPDQAGREILFSTHERFTFQGQRSYLPVPLFYTEQGVGVLHQCSCEFFARFWSLDGGQTNVALCYQCEPGPTAFQDIFLFGAPTVILRQYQDLTGPAITPPEWCFGPWMSSNRWECADQVEEQLAQMEQHQIPATVLVLERWSDDTIFDRFEDASHHVEPGSHCFCDEELDFTHNRRWPSPRRLCQKIQEHGLKLILWQAPILRLPPDGQYPQAEQDIAYAIKNHYCVMMPSGQPFRCAEGWFKGSLLLDFTNPKAVAWWQAKHADLILSYGVAGFKTDSGELVTDDRALFYNGANGRSMRNLYPLYYEAAYRQLLEKHGVHGINFTRAGYSGAQCYAIHWTGDQQSCFCECRAQLSACLSAGLSGVLFMGFDLAGFAGRLPTKELFCRAVCFAAFSTLMQFHSEPTDTGADNDRSPWNLARVYHAPDLLAFYRRYAQLRMQLLPYLAAEAAYCAQSARPLMAHLVLDWPDDEQAQTCYTQYMLGRSLLVAPVLQEGVLGRRVYLPQGCWFTASTGMPAAPGWHDCPCGWQEIPVFVRGETDATDTLLKILRREGSGHDAGLRPEGNG